MAMADVEVAAGAEAKVMGSGAGGAESGQTDVAWEPREVQAVSTPSAFLALTRKA
jgi:hypothetical protein